MAWPIGASGCSFGRAIGFSLLLAFSHFADVHAADASASARTGLQPLIEKAKGGQCVEDPAFMRRNHMKLLKHQRDDTMHGGIRTGKYSLPASPIKASTPRLAIFAKAVMCMRPSRLIALSATPTSQTPKPRWPVCFQKPALAKP